MSLVGDTVNPGQILASSGPREMPGWPLGQAETPWEGTEVKNMSGNARVVHYGYLSFGRRTGLSLVQMF